MDPSCKKVVPILGIKSVPEIGTKSGAKVHKLVPFFGNRFGSRKTEPKTDRKTEKGCTLYMFLYTLGSFAAPSLWAAMNPYFGS